MNDSSELHVMPHSLDLIGLLRASGANLRPGSWDSRMCDLHCGDSEYGYRVVRCAVMGAYAATIEPGNTMIRGSILDPDRDPQSTWSNAVFAVTIIDQKVTSVSGTCDANDEDTGTIIDGRPGEVLVAWSTGARTWTPVADIKAVI